MVQVSRLAREVGGGACFRIEGNYDRKREWNKIVDRAMATDYSWKVSAGKYQEMYDWLIG